MGSPSFGLIAVSVAWAKQQASRQSTRVLGIVILLVVGLSYPSMAQRTTDLFWSNDSTLVRKISFKFTGDRHFAPDRLQAQIALRAPGFWDRVRRILPFFTVDRKKYRLNPVELQKDVVRLRRFYTRNGFLDSQIDYPVSQLDTSRNNIHVIFNIREGPPLEFRNLTFQGPAGGPAEEQFAPVLRPRWAKLENEILRSRGQRFTEANRILLNSRILSWLQDRGYAFPTIDSDAKIDSLAHRVDVRYTIDAGPMSYFDQIEVEGNTSVSDRVVRRELPFKRGDRFSSGKISRGQRELFGLNLFRVALVDIPPAPAEQPRDSTVAIRFRVREARPRYITTQIGYAREDGLGGQIDWKHRNFFGDARQFAASVGFQSGFGAVPQSERVTERSFSTSLSLRQPYIFTTRLSGVVSPFATWLDDKNQLGTRSWEVGLNSALIFEILSLRIISLQHTFARVFPLGDTPLSDTLNAHNKNVFTLGATLGKLNDFQNPVRGFLVRPTAEVAAGLNSGVSYFKTTTEFIYFIPFGRHINFSGRLFLGRLWPTGGSRNQQQPDVEFRFDPIRFYSGGGGDVRGWANQLLGDKFAHPVPDSSSFIYEAVGGESKISGSLEIRWPFPGLSRFWGLATFLDFGAVSGKLKHDADGRIVYAGAVGESPEFGEQNLLVLNNLRFALGGGLRYQTPIGILRFDVGYKLNPTDEDLQDPEERFRFDNGETGPPKRRLGRRINLHFSIGQTF